MGLLEIITEKKGEKQQYICLNCHAPLHPLEGSIEKIYICESCGNTFDFELIKNSKRDCSTSKQPIFNLFNEAFMKRYTKFDCFKDFLEQSPLNAADCFESFDEAIVLANPKLWNDFIKDNTTFSTWEEMFEKAVEMKLHV